MLFVWLSYSTYYTDKRKTFNFTINVVIFGVYLSNSFMNASSSSHIICVYLKDLIVLWERGRMWKNKKERKISSSEIGSGGSQESMETWNVEGERLTLKSRDFRKLRASPQTALESFIFRKQLDRGNCVLEDNFNFLNSILDTRSVESVTPRSYSRDGCSPPVVRLLWVNWVDRVSSRALVQ